MIGVNVGLENVSNSESRFTRHVHVNIYICSRIEYCSHTFIIITEYIRKLRDSFGLNGFKNE